MPPVQPTDEVQREIMRWLTSDAGFAQVFTINRDGFPTGRTMGGPINADWSVDLIQGISGFDRVNQVRANDRMELLWIDTMSEKVVPRAVFLRGRGQVYGGDQLLVAYAARMERNTARGRPNANPLPPDQVLATLIGIKVTPLRIRAEGFGERSEVFTWTP